MPSFNANSRRYTPEIVLSRKKSSKVVNWIIVDILMYLINLMLSLAKSFLLKITIAKDHELSHSAQ